MPPFPALFLSHGAPTLIIEDGPARRFLAGYGARLGRPSAILVASAHWEEPVATVSTAERPETIHDFYGFPPELYSLRYPAPGAPAVAEQAASLIEAAGLPVLRDADRGLDHGAWVPLSLMYAQADIPVAQVSLLRSGGPDAHLKLGAALRPLRDQGVLILGSGSTTHNLAAFRGFNPDAPAPAWVTGFADWVHGAATAGRTADLLDYRNRAPYGRENHPTEEHLLPFFVALGSADPGTQPERVHASTSHGILAMDVYAFA